MPKYSEEDIKNAIAEIKNGVPIASAGRKFMIPASTLSGKLRGIYPMSCKKGPATILTVTEEQHLENWLLHIADAGFPATKTQLLDSVQHLMISLNRESPFTDGRPGRHWYESFLRRHPIISSRVSQNLSKARSSVTEENIRKWFAEVEDHLIKTNNADILDDSSRIYNMDESAFFLSPKGSYVLARKGEKAIYNIINNDEKECLTALLGGSASGLIIPPMIVFSYKRLPQSIVNMMPDNWGIGKSDSGWMTGETFFEYITNVFDPWLKTNSIKKPILLYVDGHTSHMTMHLSHFCSENGIILVALYPNATHILQPMDVGVFHPLKSAWLKGVQKWRVQNKNDRLKREYFAPLLKKV